MNLYRLLWKQSFRAPQWQSKISIKIIIALFMIYFVGSILFATSYIYPILSKKLPELEPVDVFSRVLLFVFLTELLIRFFLQKLPVTNIQSLILLPLKKRKIINHVLIRSLISPFNLLPFIAYLPFAISMYRDDYLISQSMAWWFACLCITLCISLLVFLINKKPIYFFVVLSFFAAIILLNKYADIDFSEFVGNRITDAVQQPLSSFFFLLPVLIVYTLVFLFLKKGFYLDASLSQKKSIVRGGDFSFLNFLGKDALFLKNDLRMIIRNVRPRQIVMMSFLFLFYGLIFFSNDVYSDQSVMLVFASLFVTGGFLMTFGNYVPAWDSSYYKLLMTQNVSYKDYLLSKWNLIVFVTALSTLLAIPYVYFGIDVLIIIIAGAIFNIGLGSWITLFGGLLNKTPMKLNVKAKAFENTQAFSLNQFLLVFPKLVLPMFLYWLSATFFSPTLGYISLGASGVLGILFKNWFAQKITTLYIKQKHETIEAFNK